MTKIKISLVDNDYVVHARAEMTDLEKSGVLALIQHLDEDFVHGENAFIEIEGLKKGMVKLLVSQVDA